MGLGIKADERLIEEQLITIITAAVPAYAYRESPHEWTWTRTTGVWHLNLSMNRDEGPSMKARLDGRPSLLQVCVRTTRREINAALRWLVLVDAIDRHPDDPQPIMQESDYA